MAVPVMNGDSVSSEGVTSLVIFVPQLPDYNKNAGIPDLPHEEKSHLLSSTLIQFFGIKEKEFSSALTPLILHKP